MSLVTITPGWSKAAAIEEIGRLSRLVMEPQQLDLPALDDYRADIAIEIRIRAKEFTASKELPCVDPTLHWSMGSRRMYHAITAFIIWRDVVLQRPLSWWSLAMQIEAMCGGIRVPDDHTPATNDVEAYEWLTRHWNRRDQYDQSLTRSEPWPGGPANIIASITLGCHVISPLAVDTTQWEVIRRKEYLSRTSRERRRLDAWQNGHGVDTIRLYDFVRKTPPRTETGGAS
jgi:hypothetical protein